MGKLKKSLKKRFGMTLIEVLVGASIFTIGYAGLLIGVRNTRYSAVNDMIKFVAAERANGIVNMIQCYPYEEEAIKNALDSNPQNVSIPFNLHTVGTTFNSGGTSGIVQSDGSVNPIPQQNLIALAYQRTFQNTRSTVLTPRAAEQDFAEDPFNRAPVIHGNFYLLGPENDDIWSGHTDTANGIYLINHKQNLTNSFETPRAYFFDDVDDFDGYQEVVQIADNVNVTYTVSVSLVYGNQQNFTMPLVNNAGDTVQQNLNQGRYAPMSPINFQNGTTANSPIDLTANFPLAQQQTFYTSYYRNALFKKITVVAAWTYPPGSTNQHQVVIDNGASNPNIGA